MSGGVGEKEGKKNKMDFIELAADLTALITVIWLVVEGFRRIYFGKKTKKR